jgi:hypothetical protein
MNPRTAKIRFRLRTFNNIALVVVLFTICAVVAAQFSIAWLIDFAAILTLYFLFFSVLANRPIGIRCPDCRKHLTTNTPWICAVCHRQNLKTDTHPFVGSCENCGSEPKAYRCHHCNAPIFFSADEAMHNVAYCLGLPTTTVKEVDKSKLKSEEKEERRHQIEMMELDEKLNSLRNRIQFSAPKSVKEKKIAAFDEIYDGLMSIREHARMREIEVRELFKDHPDLLKDALATIKEAQERIE